MTTPAVTQPPPQQTQPPQPPPDQQLALQIALALSAAVTVADAVAMLGPILAAFKIRGAMMSAVLGIVMGMPPEQAGVAGPASLNVSRLNQLRRAQFAVSALHRLSADELLAQAHGRDPAAALAAGYQRETKFYGQHLMAIWQRQKSAAQVDDAARSHGLLLGWNTTLDSRTSAECRAANRHNFRADIVPLIGYPGSVHPHCRCWPGKPFRNAALLPSASGVTP